MSDHINKTIEDAQGELRKREQAVRETKRFINQLCKFGQMELMYPEAEGDDETSAAPSAIRRNAFYGKPLATCVREILEIRQRSGQGHREASLEDIMAALKAGSFDIGAISKDADGQKRGVAISLAKNSATFHKLPNGDFGLMEWYDHVRKAKAGEKAATASAGDKQADDEQAEPNTAPIDGKSDEIETGGEVA